jgi:predicted transcriptional regulator
MTPGQVRDALGADWAYTTVMTVLARLCDKGLFTRRVGRAFACQAVLDEDEVTARQMQRLLDTRGDRAAVLTRFVGTLSVDDERLLVDLLRRTGDNDAHGPPMIIAVVVAMLVTGSLAAGRRRAGGGAVGSPRHDIRPWRWWPCGSSVLEQPDHGLGQGVVVGNTSRHRLARGGNAGGERPRSGGWRRRQRFPRHWGRGQHRRDLLPQRLPAAGLDHRDGE